MRTALCTRTAGFRARLASPIIYQSKGIQSIKTLQGLGALSGQGRQSILQQRWNPKLRESGIWSLIKGRFVVTSSSSSPEPSLRRHGPSFYSSLWLYYQKICLVCRLCHCVSILLAKVEVLIGKITFCWYRILVRIDC